MDDTAKGADMTEANSPTERLDRLEERVDNITRTLGEMQGEIDRTIEAARAKLAESGRTV